LHGCLVREPFRDGRFFDALIDLPFALRPRLPAHIQFAFSGEWLDRRARPPSRDLVNWLAGSPALARLSRRCPIVVEFPLFEYQHRHSCSFSFFVGSSFRGAHASSRCCGNGITEMNMPRLRPLAPTLDHFPPRHLSGNLPGVAQPVWPCLRPRDRNMFGDLHPPRKTFPGSRKSRLCRLLIKLDDFRTRKPLPSHCVGCFSRFSFFSASTGSNGDAAAAEHRVACTHTRGFPFIDAHRNGDCPCGSAAPKSDHGEGTGNQAPPTHPLVRRVTIAVTASFSPFLSLSRL